MIRVFAAALLALPVVACGNPGNDGRPGNPPSTATQRALDRATDSPRTSADGTGNNPAGTAVERAYDRATGSNVSGAYPGNSGGVPQRP